MQSNKTCVMELYLEDQDSSPGFTISYPSKKRVQVWLSCFLVLKPCLISLILVSPMDNWKIFLIRLVNRLHEVLDIIYLFFSAVNWI